MSDSNVTRPTLLMPLVRCLAVLVVLLSLLGCGGSDGDSDPSASAEEAASQAENAETPTLKEVTPDDAMVVLEQSNARLTVVNFWATWCVPCVEEFPAFVKLDRTLDDRGVDVIFISTDFPNEKKKVVEFLAEHGVTGTSYLKTGNSTEFVNSFSEEWSGAVPATFIYDEKDTLLDFWEGKVSYEELKQRATSHLDNT